MGSTATLILERYKASGLTPEEPTAIMLLSAVLSDTVVLNSPTTTDRDRKVVKYLEELLDLDAEKFGREMFEASSDVSDLSAEEIVNRDAKEYATSTGEKMCVAQIETVGIGALERKDELTDALEDLRADNDYLFAALMVTDIIGGGTELLCAGECAHVERGIRRHGRGRGYRTSRRHEPQEAGRTQAARGSVGWFAARTAPSATSSQIFWGSAGERFFGVTGPARVG